MTAAPPVLDRGAPLVRALAALLVADFRTNKEAAALATRSASITVRPGGANGDDAITIPRSV